MRLIWTVEASADHGDIISYIADRNPDAAERMRVLFDLAAQRLTKFPKMHRQGRVADTGEAVVHPNYIMVYRFDQDTVSITAVLHARQQYP